MAEKHTSKKTAAENNSAQTGRSGRKKNERKALFFLTAGVCALVFGVSAFLLIRSKSAEPANVVSTPDPAVTDIAATDPVLTLGHDTKIPLSFLPEEQEFAVDHSEAVSQELALMTAGAAKSIPMILDNTYDGKQMSPSFRSRILAAKARNADTVAWMRIKDSTINFAVVQSTKNNLVYTNLGYDKEYSHYGVAWSAATNTFGTRDKLSVNTVLFGHNWDNISAVPRICDPNDIMFEQLPAYIYPEFAAEHPYINFSTSEEDMVWVVVSTFYTEDYWKVGFNYIDTELTPKQTQTFIDEIMVRSEYIIPESQRPLVTDKFLTLSTCTRAKGGTGTQRLVIVARLLREGEELPVMTYEKNPKPKAPAL